MCGSGAVELAVLYGVLPVMYGAFGTLCGGVLGALAQVRWALWAYCAGTLPVLGARLYLTFEMSRHERAVARAPLLIDMMATSLCVFVSLSAMDTAASLALDLRHNQLARAPSRSARL